VLPITRYLGESGYFVASARYSIFIHQSSLIFCISYLELYPIFCNCYLVISRSYQLSGILYSSCYSHLPFCSSCLIIMTSCLVFWSSWLLLNISCLVFDGSCLTVNISCLVFFSSWLILNNTFLVFSSSCLTFPNRCLAFCSSCLIFKQLSGIL